MMNVNTNYSPIRWSKAIQNKDKLEKLFSAVFSKIAKMRIRLSDAIASFRSHDFTSLAEQYISRNIYASEKLINHITTFKDSDVGKDSEPLEIQDRDKKQQAEALDKQYKKMMDRNRKDGETQQRSDPWSNMRTPNEGKGK